MTTGTSASWREALGPLVERLEREWLPAWLPERRWFQGKSRGIERVALQDGVILDRTDDSLTLMLQAGVWMSDPTSFALYQVPLQLCREAKDVDEAFLVGRAVVDGLETLVVDGLAAPEAPRALLRLIADSGTLPTDRGYYAGEPTSAFATLVQGPLEPVRISKAEQSHTNVIFGDRLLLKVFRAMCAGINPDIELTRCLTERTAFRNMPALAGFLTHVVDDEEGEYPSHAAMLQEFLPNLQQGWEWMLNLLTRYLGASLSGDGGPRNEARRISLNDAKLLARRTAEMHQALASVRDDPDYAPMPFDLEDWRRTSTDIQKQTEKTRASAAGASHEEALRALERVPAWLARQDQAIDIRHLGDRQRIHGDYHLGQTLRTADDYILLDFEGEPSKPIDERRRKQSPLRDVAGMLRSFDYAAFAALDQARECRSGRELELERTAREWVAEATRLFEEEYAPRATGEPSLSADRRALLDRLLVEKALYELDYELNNRPTWVSIPLRGLRGLLGD